ncbi:hypothetical protein TWF696_005557 [Orbilia brochopaga]|uniref:Uncharacterized protein n=1 Tax=Orbilia brochopaga TaxID=3140254 RepID=A0AAV9V1W3_9PEZI
MDESPQNKYHDRSVSTQTESCLLGIPPSTAAHETMSSPKPRPISRRDRLDARVARQKAQLERDRACYALRKQLMKSLSLDDIGRLLGSYQTMDSIEQLEHHMSTSEEYPEFRAIWNSKTVKISFVELIMAAMSKIVVEHIEQ